LWSRENCPRFLKTVWGGFPFPIILTVLNNTAMFEAKIKSAAVLKKIVEALKELVNEAKFECTSSGISLQAMDQAHVSLVAMLLRAEGFEDYRCDRNISLGLSLETMSKVLKCAGNDDSVTIRAADDGDNIHFVFESKNKVSNFELKQMHIDAESLGIPETEYKAVVKMPAVEFQKTCANLTTWGDAVAVSASKEGVSFSVSGELGKGNVNIKQGAAADAEEGEATTIELNEPVNLTFALRKLCAFTRATALSTCVSLSLSDDVPLAVEYTISELGYIRYYLAPKIEDDK